MPTGQRYGGMDHSSLSRVDTIVISHQSPVITIKVSFGFRLYGFMSLSMGGQIFGVAVGDFLFFVCGGG